jgi:glycerol kinase
MPELLLALDAGTTSARAMLVGPDGAVLGLDRRGIETRYPGNGRAEQDGMEIWRALMGAVDGVLAAAGRTMADVAAIGVTTQRAGVVIWDAATVDPVAPIIVWSDLGSAQRSAEIIAAGFPCWPQLPSAKLEALLARAPDGRARAARGELKWGPIDSWLTYRLSGGGAHITDLAGAWFTGYLDYHQPNRWHPGLLAFQDLADAFFPRVTDSWGALAETAPALFGRPIPITALMADQQAGLVAHGALAQGAWKSTYGTSAVLLASLGQTPVQIHPALSPAAAVQAKGVPTFCTEGMVFSAGAALEWLSGGLKLFASPAAAAQAAARAKSDTGVVLVPSLHGLGAPHMRLEARGMIAGLSPDVGPAEIALAALTGIASRVREIAEVMAGLPGAERRASLPVDGGLTADAGFLQIQADVLGLPVRRHAVREATAYGAALAAGMGVGLIDPARLAEYARYDLEVTPLKSRDEADATFARWSAVRALLTDR